MKSKNIMHEKNNARSGKFRRPGCGLPNTEPQSKENMNRLFALCLLAGALALNIPGKSPEVAIAVTGNRLVHDAVDTFHSDARGVDEVYVCPVPSQVPALIAYCEKMRTKRYVANAFDCDDIAKEWSVNAARWSNDTWPGLNAAIAAGIVWVRVEGTVDGIGKYPRGLHAMNVLRLATGQWIFIEPSSGRWVNVEGAIYEGTIEVFNVEL